MVRLRNAFCGERRRFSTAPLNDETRGIVSADVPARMKPTALLLNTRAGRTRGRGRPCRRAGTPDGWPAPGLDVLPRSRRSPATRCSPQKLPDHAAHRVVLPRGRLRLIGTRSPRTCAPTSPGARSTSSPDVCGRVFSPPFSLFPAERREKISPFALFGRSCH